MAVRIHKGGLSVILKLFLILYIAVLVTFIAPFSSDPSRYTVGALFTAAGGSYILASKLPSTNIFSLASLWACLSAYFSLIRVIRKCRRFLFLPTRVRALVLRFHRGKHLRVTRNNLGIRFRCPYTHDSSRYGWLTILAPQALHECFGFGGN